MVVVKRHHIIVENKDVDETKTIKVKVPRGIVTGGSIVTEVMHTETELHNVKTTYIFKTEEIPHKYFKRENLNLILCKELTLKEAICGIKINVKTLDHKVLRVNITQVITPDYTKIIHGEGMPDANDFSKYGDIIIKFQINYPIYGPTMDKEVCEILKPLKKSSNTMILEDKKNI
ncbi:dnaJ homolog subfamily B member 1-like [Adelges cooleyi]|uniref:dnaJ homolog subfamily B member 1-like n=1 Tax=Adelges cooleyi TaxID=133065 RepID=UPI0021801D24|nr:dnaJ homolog subfamily B member 1-like [Adelges cooleyi]